MNFEIETIDFTVKRLGLEHKPRIQSTVSENASFNQIGEAIHQLKTEINQSYLQGIKPTNHGLFLLERNHRI